MSQRSILPLNGAGVGSGYWHIDLLKRDGSDYAHKRMLSSGETKLETR